MASGKTQTKQNNILLVTSWDQVSFSQFMGIKPGMPVADVISVLLSKTRQEVDAMSLDLQAWFAALAFLDTPVVQSVQGPADIEAKEIVRYEDMRLYTSKFKGDATDLEHYPVIFATYYQHTYNSDTVDKLIPSVEAMPCGVVIGTVNHYLKEITRIEEKWGKLFPKTGYTTEQTNAGFRQIDEFFGFAGTLFHMEQSTPYKEEEILKWTVATFKYRLLYLAKRGEAQKKYSDGQAAKVRQQTQRRR